MTKKKKAEEEGERRIFVLINVRRSRGNPCKTEREQQVPFGLRTRQLVGWSQETY